MENFNNITIIDESKFRSTLDRLLDFLSKIKHILLINVNDIFFNDIIKKLSDDSLIIDTIQILKLVNYDLAKIGYSNDFVFYLNNYKNKDIDIKSLLTNKFHKLAMDLDEILKNLPEKVFNLNPNEEEIQNSNYDLVPEKLIKSKNSSVLGRKNTRMSIKKSYEVERLSKYMIGVFKRDNVKNLLEMGCGKSYLTDEIFTTEDMVYIGVDKKDHLIKQTELETKKNKKTSEFTKSNIHLINSFITSENFQQIYESEISDKLYSKTQNFNNDNINNIDKLMIFGLHSCGNLTSDSIKVFVKNSQITHLVIVGCCLHSLTEYISPEAANSEIFKNYVKFMVGHDSKGNYLEQTICYDYSMESNYNLEAYESKIGYPLSKYMKTLKKYEFLGRPLRNIAMQPVIDANKDNKNMIIDSIANHKYRKMLYRTILQSFFEEFLPELRNIYGYSKIKFNLNDDYKEYLLNFFEYLKSMIEKDELKLECFNLKASSFIEKVEKLENEVKLSEKSEDTLDPNKFLKFFEDKKKLQDILWAFYLIRIKFAKIIEYIIALDRIVYLEENNIKNIELVKIFEDNKSARNLLISASK